jgi:uncharacterized protein
LSATLPAMRRALVIVGKAPRPGQAKTRLVPPLSPEDAAELARAFLLDTVALGLALGWECVSVVHPIEDGDVLQALLPCGARCIAQSGTGLGAALRSAFAAHFSEGYERAVLIDSDSPTLPSRILQAACDQLDTHDVTIGPSADGGYYLLGLRQSRPRLFEGIAWSTPRVYAQTLERARGLRVHPLDKWYDVDTPDDLARLEADLRQQPADVATHTRTILQRVTLRAAG